MCPTKVQRQSMNLGEIRHTSMKVVPMSTAMMMACTNWTTKMGHLRVCSRKLRSHKTPNCLIQGSFSLFLRRGRSRPIFMSSSETTKGVDSSWEISFCSALPKDGVMVSKKWSAGLSWEGRGNPAWANLLEAPEQINKKKFLAVYPSQNLGIRWHPLSKATSYRTCERSSTKK